MRKTRAMGQASVARAIVVDRVDPRSAGRVAVRYPWHADAEATHWARLAAPYAGRRRGFYVVPEVGDEVLVAFEHGDERRPFVIGSLWSGNSRPPATSPDLRTLRTRSGHTLVFDDGPSAAVTLALADGKRLAITGDGITVEDERGNGLTIRTSAGGMMLRTTGAMEIEAARITVRASGTIDVRAGATLDLRGSLVRIN